ncbi:MAG: biosynthetic peptidoglycan transglycosylase, partial [Vicinamibacterales bacterium]
DQRFLTHGGFDFDGIRRALRERRGRQRGASTITQQLAKNLYLSPARNPIRKLREILIARRLEAELTKQRILELYLNVIEWGDGVYGAEAAARRYFHRSAAQLGPQESALLAAAIINPRVLDPGRPSARLRRRQQTIARRMGTVRPPPVVSVSAESDADATRGLEEPIDPVPALPAGEMPAVLPGEIVPQAPPPPARPCDTPPCR